MTVAVVGAGIFGAAAALELARRGHRVTVFDADAVPAPRAASTDEAKAIRRVGYAGDKAGYVELVERSADRWHAWERETGRRVLHRTGHLSIVRDAARGSLMYESVHVLHGRGAVEVQELSAAALRRRFPQFTVADGEAGVYDPWGGYLEGAAAVRMLVDLAVDAGVTLRERTAVAAVGERAGAAAVRVDGVEHAFDRVVVAAGAWIGRLLPALARRLTITRQELVLLPTPGDAAAFAGPRMPTWGAEPDGEQWYGFPLLREGYVKVARDRLGPAVNADVDDADVDDADVDGADVDRAGTSAFAADVEAMLRRRIPALAGSTGARGRSCLYTMTPDAHFIIDRVPGSERLVVAGAGSGHAFKFGGVLGPLIAGVVEGRPDPAGAPFRIGGRLGDRPS